MSWLEDHARNHADRAMEHAYQVVGPGYGWAGGKFGRLLTTAIRWGGAALAIVMLVLWVKNGAHLYDIGIGSKPDTHTTEQPADKPKGGF